MPIFVGVAFKRSLYKNDVESLIQVNMILILIINDNGWNIDKIFCQMWQIFCEKNKYLNKLS